MNGNINQLLDRLVEDGFRDNIRIICEFANLYLGTLKYQTYGTYALIQMVVHGLNVTSSRSHLRKFFDACVQCAVEAMTGGMSVDEMEEHSAGSATRSSFSNSSATSARALGAISNSGAVASVCSHVIVIVAFCDFE